MNNIVILSSSLCLWDYDESGNRIPKNFGNNNELLDNFKKYIKRYDNFLFVASSEIDTEITDMYAKNTFASFDLTLPFTNYQILDIRTEHNCDELIKNADFIYLCGGHVPTQNSFFAKIGFKDKLKDSNALIVGASAGSMNCARKVYCPPELEGESLDYNFKRYIDGLALTDINILPHYSDEKDSILDGKRFIEDIVLPDSYNTCIYAISDGDYILVNGEENILYGEAYKIENGNINLISKKQGGTIL